MYVYPLFAVDPLFLGESPSLLFKDRSQVFSIAWKGLGNSSVVDSGGLAHVATVLALFPGCVTLS